MLCFHTPAHTIPRMVQPLLWPGSKGDNRHDSAGSQRFETLPGGSLTDIIPPGLRVLRHFVVTSLGQGFVLGAGSQGWSCDATSPPLCLCRRRNTDFAVSSSVACWRSCCPRLRTKQNNNRITNKSIRAPANPPRRLFTEVRGFGVESTSAALERASSPGRSWRLVKDTWFTFLL